MVSRVCLPAFTDYKTLPETDFLTTDREVCLMVRYLGAHKGDKDHAEWVNPEGTIVQRSPEYETISEPDPGHKNISRHPSFRISGNNAASLPGAWHVRLLHNGVEIADLPFHISVPAPSKLELISGTVLPHGTVDFPYYYRFTIRDGQAPYRWTATGGLPTALSFSADGELTGTPVKQGGYQFSVTAQDEAGNTLTRTVAMGVAVPSTTRVVARGLTGSSTGIAQCASGPNTVEFSTKQATITLDFTISRSTVDRYADGRADVEWLNPSGDIVHKSEVRKQGPAEECFRQTFPLAKQKEVTPGKWRVRVVWASAEAFSIPFTVASARVTARSPRVVPGRWALLIGNGSYQQLPVVPSAAKDLELMEKALKVAGFDVTSRLNLSLEEWRLVERDFVAKVQKKGVAVVYYTGHGLHEGPENWLVPVTYDPGDHRPLSTKAYALARLRQLLEEKEVDLAVLFLNAAGRADALEQGRQRTGFAAPAADPHTVICLAAPPNKTDSEAGTSDRGSAFARALAKVINQPNSGLQQLDGELRKAFEPDRPNGAGPTTLMVDPPPFKWGIEEDPRTR